MHARVLVAALALVAVAAILGGALGAPPAANVQPVAQPSSLAPTLAPTPTPTLVAAPITTPAATPTAAPVVLVPEVRVHDPEPADSISPPFPRRTPAPPAQEPSDEPADEPADEPSDEPATGSGGGGGRANVPADGRPTRVVFASLGIDLPIVAGDLRVRGNPNFYPLCDVAQYMMEFGYPGQVGTAYIYAHAQRGMFLPMLRASRRNNGAEMIGKRVDVYTSDSRLHIYEVFRVKRHSTDLKIAFNLQRGEHRLILQTSEGPPGHRPVLQVAARPVRVVDASAAQAMPRAKPRVCWPGR